MRYEWLVTVARENSVRWIATGHTADDQAETVLHRLIRGCGLKGLRSIAAKRSLTPDVGLVRPLLDTTRAEVLGYLESEGQTFCRDSSNLDMRFTRNRIRHKLLPLLQRRYNPGIVKLLNRLAKQADETFGIDEARARELLLAAEHTRAGRTLVLDRRQLGMLPGTWFARFFG